MVFFAANVCTKAAEEEEHVIAVSVALINFPHFRAIAAAAAGDEKLT